MYFWDPTLCYPGGAGLASKRLEGWAQVAWPGPPRAIRRQDRQSFSLPELEFIAAAKALPSPFDVSKVVDLDVRFAAKAMVIMGPFLEAWREAQRHSFDRACEAVDPPSESPACINVPTHPLSW